MPTKYKTTPIVLTYMAARRLLLNKGKNRARAPIAHPLASLRCVCPIFFRKKRGERQENRGTTQRAAPNLHAKSKDTTLNDWQAGFVSATRFFF